MNHKFVWLAGIVLCLWRWVHSLPAIFPSGGRRSSSHAAAATASHTSARQCGKSQTSAEVTSELLLPGNITPITEAYIFARASGYLKRRYVDIGDRVASGTSCWPKSTHPIWISRCRRPGRAGAGEEPARPGGSDPATTDRDSRSCGDHVAAVQGADDVRERYRARTAICNRRRRRQPKPMSRPARERGARGGGICPRQQGRHWSRLVTLQGYERITAPFAGHRHRAQCGCGRADLGRRFQPGTHPAQSGTAPSDVPSSGEIFRVARHQQTADPGVRAANVFAQIQVGQAAKRHGRRSARIGFSQAR